MPRDVFFICYSHTDTIYKQRFDKFLRGPKFQQWEIFSDSQISPGEEWQQQIREHLKRASAALLLVSQDFMISPFIQQVELRELLASHIQRGLQLFLVPVRATHHEGTYLERFQWARPPDKPFSLLTEAEQEQAMVEVCKLISRAPAAPAASIDHSLECLANVPTLDLPPSYELQGVLAEGEFARCYRAHDRVLGQSVIIKVLHEDLTRDSPAYDKYVLSASRLKHRNILGVLYCQTSKRPHYLVTPYVDGGTLRERLSDVSKPPTFETAVSWTIQLARTLHYAHSHGWVHGRLRPEEVLIDAEGQPTLTGFRTRDGLGVPCPSGKRSLEEFWYSSPETRQTGRVDPLSDQYLLGLLAYEMLAGKKPVELSSWACVMEPEFVRAIHHPRSLKDLVPGCRSELSSVIARALALDPAERWPDLDTFAQSLEESFRTTSSTQAKESYRRYAQEDTFYKTVYDSLFAKLPAARAMFGTSLEQQYKVLRHAIWLLLSFHDTRETEEPTILSSVARTHVHRTPEEYDLFRDAILAAVREHDGPDVVKHWQTTMQPGFDYLKSALAKPAPLSGVRAVAPELAAAPVAPEAERGAQG